MEKDCRSGPKQVLQFLHLLVTIKHQDYILGARKAITGLINAGLNFIKMVSLYNWETANGASLRPHRQWGHILWGPPLFSVFPASAATSENAEWDFPTRVTVQINELDPSVAILTGIHSPVLLGTIGFILDRGGLTLKGLQILPGLIAPDYSGEIKLMALSHSFHVIPQGQKIGQLLLLPYHTPNNFNPVTRGEQGCGSTGDQVACFNQQILSDRPTCQVKFEESPSLVSKILGLTFPSLLLINGQMIGPWLNPRGKYQACKNPNNLLKVQQFFLA